MDNQATKSSFNLKRAILVFLFALIVLLFFFMPMANIGFSRDCLDPNCPEDKVTLFQYFFVYKN